MRIRHVLIATAALSSSVAAGAQPDKREPQGKPQSSVTTSPVVLASANDVRRPITPNSDNSSQPVRRPAPRVTTCRCGDPQPDQDQQQPDK